MTSALINVSFSLPEWQTVKMILFAPCMGAELYCCVMLFHTQFSRMRFLSQLMTVKVPMSNIMTYIRCYE